MKHNCNQGDVISIMFGAANLAMNVEGKVKDTSDSHITLETADGIMTVAQASIISLMMKKQALECHQAEEDGQIRCMVEDLITEEENATYNEEPASPVEQDITEETMPELAPCVHHGTIMRYTKEKYGFIREDGTDKEHFFFIKQVNGVALRMLLAQEKAYGVGVTFVLGHNEEKIAASNIKLNDEWQVKYKEKLELPAGVVSYYDYRSDQGEIKGNGVMYQFSSEDVADPFLKGYLLESFNPQNTEVRFKIGPVVQGKRRAASIRHISTIGAYTELAQYGKPLTREQLATWVALYDEETEIKDPYPNHPYEPLAVKKGQPLVHIPARVSSQRVVPEFQGTTKEWITHTKEAMDAGERMLRRIFGCVYPQVDDYHYSDLKENPKAIISILRKAYPTLHLDSNVLLANGAVRAERGANPSLLEILTLGFLVSVISCNWELKFRKYFSPADFDWKEAISDMAKMRNLLSHNYQGDANKEDMARIVHICDMILHMP